MVVVSVKVPINDGANPPSSCPGPSTPISASTSISLSSSTSRAGTDNAVNVEPYRRSFFGFGVSVWGSGVDIYRDVDAGRDREGAWEAEEPTGVIDLRDKGFTWRIVIHISSTESSEGRGCECHLRLMLSWRG